MAPGFKPPPGLRPWASKVPPTERAGSEGSALCCLRQRPLLVAGATTFAPKGETTHYILRVADASSKCVRCAPLWEACHWILSRPRAPCESSSLATPLKRWNCGYWAVASIWVYGSRGEKTIQPGFARENKQTGLRPRKCTPFGANAPPFPRRGNFALLSASEFISISKRSADRISPSGGDVAIGDRRGCARHGCNLMGESP